MWCSPSSMPTTTPKTGRTCCRTTSRSARTSTCGGSPTRAAPDESGDLVTLMKREWNDSQPIYRQLRDRVVAMILDGVLKEGGPLPSVRNVAAEYRVNPLTVLKGYQELVDEGLVETRRGRGMYINAGACKMLLQGERQKFLRQDWPRIYATIQRLGLQAKHLLHGEGPGPPGLHIKPRAPQKAPQHPRPRRPSVAPYAG